MDESFSAWDNLQFDAQKVTLESLIKNRKILIFFKCDVELFEQDYSCPYCTRLQNWAVKLDL